MGLTLEYFEGQTPLDDDEREGLLIPSITTRGELDEFEQNNIEQAIEWTLSKRFKLENLFTEKFIKTVHKKMYGDVWSWAGEFRKTNKNIGVDKYQIGVALRQLLEDAIFWRENNTFNDDEFAVRFKHRIVSIHCFPNGNGRHSRLIADIIAQKLFKRKAFTWGASDLVHEGNTRSNYLKAIRAADNGDLQPLINFARS